MVELSKCSVRVDVACAVAREQQLRVGRIRWFGGHNFEVGTKTLVNVPEELNAGEIGEFCINRRIKNDRRTCEVLVRRAGTVQRLHCQAPS